MIIKDISMVTKLRGGYYPYPKSEFDKNNVEFNTDLQFEDVYKCGRSAVEALFKDMCENRVSMFLSDFSKLIHEVGDVRTVFGKWTFVKRGANIGIKYLGTP